MYIAWAYVVCYICLSIPESFCLIFHHPLFLAHFYWNSFRYFYKITHKGNKFIWVIILWPWPLLVTLNLLFFMLCFFPVSEKLIRNKFDQISCKDFHLGEFNWIISLWPWPWTLYSRWYGTSIDIHVELSILLSKYFHWFRSFKF